MDGPLIEFFRAARGAGLRISPAESIDAARAVRVVGWDDRDRLRETLSLVLAKTVEEKRQLGERFDLFFRRDGFRGEEPAGDGAAAAPDEAGQAAGQGEG